MLRRDFLKASPMGAALLLQVSGPFNSANNLLRAAEPSNAVSASPPRLRIEAFDYRGVTLHESRWRKQVRDARDYYVSVSNDDILHGFRAAAGLPAPGKPLGGWCQKDSQTVFGQWLSGMARMYRATGDDTLLNKAAYLVDEWSKTIRPNGDCGMNHYTWDKLVCGLVDLKFYAQYEEALPLLERSTDWASKTLQNQNMIVVPYSDKMYYGRPQEWYTLSENLFRAYQLSGKSRFKDFAEMWLYHDYWNKFANTSAPLDAQGVHAYSHVNTFSSAAMTYAVTGDPVYLQIIKNAYDYLQNTQCFATGGYGPNERLMAPNGALGKALETRSDTFETLCGSWAGFKLARYLTQFTGEARYGDWIERLFYNGVGAALPLRSGGRNFYYSDYRVSGGMKVDYWENYTCCSGTYFQNMADYHNLIYYKDSSGLYVNLYVPSEVNWARPEGEVTLIQETGYPETDSVALTLRMKKSQTFSLKFRVPDWSSSMSLSVNGLDSHIDCKPGQWATLMRSWDPEDKITIRIPLRLRMVPVDHQHPARMAVMRGPVVLAMDFNYHDAAFQLPDNDDDLNEWLVADDSPVVFRVKRPDGRSVRLRFRPFYDFAEDFPYLMYFDLKSWPYALW